MHIGFIDNCLTRLFYGWMQAQLDRQMEVVRFLMSFEEED